MIETVENRSWLRAQAVVLVLVNCLLIAAILLVSRLGCPVDNILLPILSGVAFTIVGLLIAFYRPGNVVAWILLISGLGMLIFPAADGYIACSVSGRHYLPGAPHIAWFVHRIAPALLLLPLFILLPFLFPDGRFLSPGWRWLCIIAVVLVAAITIVTAFAPDLRTLNGVGSAYPFDSPVAWTGLGNDTYARLFSLHSTIVIVASVAGITAMALRLKRSRGIERQQMKWFAYFLASVVAVQLLLFELPAIYFGERLRELDNFSLYLSAYSVVLYAVFIGFPLVIGVAVLRYRLYDIDVIVRRTLVYGLLTAALVGIYFGLVLLAQSAFVAVTGQENPIAIVISTLVIAALFNPLRKRIQAFIDRRFYRRKYDAAQALAQFAQTARDEVNLEQLTADLQRIVRETMQPAYLELWLAINPEDIPKMRR